MSTIRLPQGLVFVSDLIEATVSQQPDLRGRLHASLGNGRHASVELSNRDQARQVQLLHFAKMCRDGKLTPRSPLSGVPVDFELSEANRCVVTWPEAQAFAASLGLTLEPKVATVEPEHPEPYEAQRNRADEPTHDWAELARTEARTIYADRRKNIGTSPSLEVLGDEVARKFRERGITGPSGHPLTGSYIKRHALQGHGITSSTSKLLATLNTRGKRGK